MNKENRFVEQDVEQIDNVLTASEVFDLETFLRDKKECAYIGLALFQNNHILERLKELISNNGQVNKDALEKFVLNMVSHPQIQVYTTIVEGEEKRLLTIEDIIEAHKIKIQCVDQNSLNNPESESNTTRAKALKTLRSCIGDIRMLGVIDDLSFAIPNKEDELQNFIPLFNIATAVKICYEAGIGIPESLINEQK